MGTIEIIQEPHELIVNGTKILMQADPSAGKHWAALLDLKQSWKTDAQRTKMHNDLLEALAGMAETDADADLIRALDVGTVTLQYMARKYAEVVAGFPTKQS